MHKKLAADLTSLAHSILQLKNKEDVLVLKQRAYELYEKLTVLAYVDEYIESTPHATETKEELLQKIEQAAEREVFVAKETDAALVNDEALTEDEEELAVEFVVKETEEHVLMPLEADKEEKEITALEDAVQEITEQPFDELEQTLFSTDDFEDADETHSQESKLMTLEEELEDTISVEVAADLFEKAPQKKSLNDALNSNLQLGLNDRIAFVNNLFEGNQGDFNRVISQINSFKTEKEAKKFINKMVKPDYDWSEQEEYEKRFMSLIERKFA